MSTVYPKKFDTSGLSASDQKIIADFHARRKIFDKYVNENNLKIFTCPSCGYPTLGERGSYGLCSVCGWEDDAQDDPKADEVWGGPNSNLSLTESRLQIGKVLDEMAEKCCGIINLNPDQVLKILKIREREIERFKKEKILSTTPFDGPVWKEYSQLGKDTLQKLINKLP